jgi:taurine-pyruvate aminotransferase
MCYFAGSAGSIPGARYSEALTARMPGLSRVYFANSGSEANEKAFKMVRQISHKHHGGRKSKILYRDRDYHGTTIACLSAGGQQERNAQYGPFTPGFVQVPHCLEYRAGDRAGEGYGERAANAIEEVILREGPDTIGALCLEPITAGGGIIVPPKGYWERVQEICRKYDILLHIDEVVCGFGRTGTWFGYQQFGIQPDIVTMAKGVASGYAAISCCVTTEAVFDKFKDDTDKLSYFRDISTFGGCTAGPAAALEVMAITEQEGLLENSSRMGDYLHEKLLELQDKHPCIGDVRGIGLFQGAELVADRETREPLDEKKVQAIVADCMAQGVIIGASNRSMPGFNNTLLFAPALIAKADDLDEVVAGVDAAITRVVG